MTGQRSELERAVPVAAWTVLVVGAADAAVRLWRGIPILEPGNPVGMFWLMVEIVAGAAPLILLAAALAGPWAGSSRRALVRGAACLAIAEILQLVRLAAAQPTLPAGLLPTTTSPPLGGAGAAVVISVLQVAGAVLIGVALTRAAVAGDLPRRGGAPTLMLVVGLVVALTQATIVVASRAALTNPGAPVPLDMPVEVQQEFVPALVGSVVPFAWAMLAAAALSVGGGAGWPWLAAGGLLVFGARIVIVLLPIAAIGLQTGDPGGPPDALVGAALVVEALGLVALVAGFLLGPTDAGAEPEHPSTAADRAAVDPPDGAARGTRPGYHRPP